jgi:DNA repair protein RadD
MTFVARPHQELGLSQIRQSLGQGRRRPMLQAPTGYGKTFIGTKIAHGVLRKDRRMIFTVPALALIDQTVEAFSDQGITDVGVIQANHFQTDWSQPIQIASVQTLMRRKIPQADVVVVDEAHRFFDFYAKWMGHTDHSGKWHGPEEWEKVPFIGMSATPWTRGLGRYYDDLLIPTTTSELIEQGYLSPFRVFAPSHPDLSKVRTVAGDYHEGDLSDVMSDRTLVADVVDTWLSRGEGRPTLCFGVDRAHAKHLQVKFEDAGVPTAYVDAYTDSQERGEIARAFASGAIKIVCNVGVLTTGVDWDVRCIILARPTKSQMLFVQIIGRGLRIADDHPIYGPKTDCLILDHSDTHLKLGFVTDIHYDELDDGRERQKKERKDGDEPLPKECPKCAFLKPAKVTVCPACGFKPERASNIECDDTTDLIEITKVKLTERAKKMDMVQKAEVYGQLKHYARSKGYKSGWAYNQYKSYMGIFPPNTLNSVPEVPPSPELLSWIKSRNIAFNKRREKDQRYARAA